MTLVALLILAVQPLAAGPGEPQELTITAETALHDGARKRTNAFGNSQLLTVNAAINADRIVYDESENAATAVGNVAARVFDHGSYLVIVADVLTVRFEGNQVDEVYFLDGQALTKKQTTAAQLIAATTPEAAKKAGTTATRLTGNHLKRVNSHTWHIDSLELVPCECNFDNPSWKIKSSSADIDTENDRASIFNASVWVYGVPMPIWFPWLSLPLTDRQTGLLFPRPGSSGLNGWSLELPVFVTLGRSADFTITPGYFFGAQPQLNPANRLANPPEYVEPAGGIKGPRLQTEFRYTPTKRTSGRITLDLIYDFKRLRDPVFGTLIDAPRGVRGQGSVLHVQDFGSGLGLRAEGFLQSDGRIQTDLVTDVIARQAGYLRSAAALFYKTASTLVTLDVVLRQDIIYGYDVFGLTPRAPGSLAPVLGPNPIQRWPGISFALPLRRLGPGPFSFDLRAEAVRHAPLRDQTGDEGTLANDGRIQDDGVLAADRTAVLAGEPAECASERLNYTAFGAARCHNQLSQKVGQGDGVWQRGEREARDRFMILPRLFAAWHPGDAVSLTTWAGWRQAFYAGEVSGRTSQRGYALMSARAETELGGTLANDSLRHSLTPIAELRAVPFVLQTASAGDAAPAPYDDVDLSVPATAGARVQAITELRQRLVNRAGREFVRLDLGQGYNLAAPESGVTGLGETYARLSVSAWWLSANSTARFDPVLNRATRLAAALSLDDGRGDGVGIAYENVLDDGTSRSRQPIDLLFGNRVPLSAYSRAQLVLGTARAKLGPLTIGYSIMFLDHVWGRVPAPVSTRLTFNYHTISAGFTPACDCWRVDVAMTQRVSYADPLRPQGFINYAEFFFNFTASRFGSIGSSN